MTRTYFSPIPKRFYIGSCSVASIAQQLWISILRLAGFLLSGYSMAATTSKYQVFTQDHLTAGREWGEFLLMCLSYQGRKALSDKLLEEDVPLHLIS